MLNRHLSTAASDPPAEPVVIFEAVNALRKMTLNRPKKLNALNEDMVALIGPQLQKWEESELANVVLFKGNGKSFCAGGDVETLVRQLDDPATWVKSATFFEKEYVVDAFIAKMRTPVVTFMTGNTMGGGVGLAMHAPFRIATELTKVAMPETRIGLFPDVGVNFFLSRMDGQLGLYFALTSQTIQGAGAFFTGFATHYVPSERLAAVEARLAELGDRASIDDVNAAIEEFVGDAKELASAQFDLVGPKRRAIDSIFSKKTAEAIVADLKALEEGTLSLKKIVLKGEDGHLDDLKSWAKKIRETIELRSPTSVKLALMMHREGKALDIDNAFKLDMRVAVACCNPDVHPDFKTGVTHLLIEKSKVPRAAWTPSTLEEVSEVSVEKIFFSNPPPFSNPPLPPLVFTHSAPTYKAYPHARFGLPSEDEIRDVVTGEAKGSDGYAVTKEEVVARLSKARKGKIGVQEKVEEVLARKCKAAEDGTLKWHY